MIENATLNKTQADTLQNGPNMHVKWDSALMSRGECQMEKIGPKILFEMTILLEKKVDREKDK